MNPLKMMLCMGLCSSSAWSASLTEASIRTVLEQRGAAFERDDVETVVNLHTANAFIAVTFPGVYDPGEDLDAREFAGSFVDSDMKNMRYKSEPLAFEFDPTTTSAVLKMESRMSYFFAGKRKRGMNYRIDETLTFVATDDGPRISRAELSVMEITLDPDELSERIMKQVRSKGGIDAATAIQLLEESGCTYRAGDGKKKTTIHSKHYGMGCGDEIAALAASIPGVQSFELVWFSALSDEALVHLGKIQTLETLSLTGLAVTDAGIAQLAQLDELRSLYLAVMDISDAALETIATLPSLEKLMIDGAPKVSDIGLAHLAKSKTLKNLSLRLNVTDKGLEQLAAIPNLTTLRLNRAEASDVGLTHVATMPNLASIYLYKTQVTHRGAKRLQKKRPKLKIYPKALTEPCADSRMWLSIAKMKWARKEKQEKGATPTREELEPYLKQRGGFAGLLCEEGGTFTINAFGVRVECSIHGTATRRKTTTREKTTNKLAPLAKENFDVDGAKLGRWTMDLAAAKKRAAEKRKSILLSFTESDRSPWCKLMEKNVFTQPAWKTYAKDSIIMVLIDFPRDKSFVPEKYKERNDALKNQYGISGYPTFVLLKPDGKTELGRLKGRLGITPASFIEEVNTLLNTKIKP